MKAFFASLFLLFVSFPVFSQTSAGSFFIGGTASISKDEGLFEYFEPSFGDFVLTSGNVTTATLLPQFGFFIADNIAIGGSIGIRSINGKSDDNAFSEIDITETFVVIAPFFRYYKMFNEKFGLTGELRPSFAFGSGNQEVDGIEIELLNTTVINLGIRPGLVYFPHPKFGIEANFGAIQVIRESIEDFGDPDTSFDINITPSNIADNGTIGFNFYF